MTKQEKEQQNKILLLGVGNILLGDEGLGVHAVNRLREKGLPENVEAVDGGTLGLELLYLLEDVDKMIVVDSLDAGAEPGSIFRFRPDDIKVQGKVELSMHDLGLIEVLTLAETMDKLPETVIFGMQPLNIKDWNMELSPVVEEKLPKVMELVLREIEA